MRLKRMVTLALVLLMVMSLLAGCTSSDTTPQNSKIAKDPRQETLFVTGMQWNPAQNFNHFSGWPAWPTDTGANPMVYEPLFLYNSVTDELVPWVGKSFKWLDNYTLEVELHEQAAFSDGEALTTDDVFYTLDVANRYYTPWTGYAEALSEDGIVIVSPQTIQFSFLQENFNAKSALEMLCRTPIHPEHIWGPFEEENNYDYGAISGYFNDNPVGSGAYQVNFHDEGQIRTKRNDAWWGKDIHGMPSPSYITHLMYNSNDASTLDLKNGILDYSQNFISQVWEHKDSGISTYLQDAPFYLEESLPTFYINTHRPGLNLPEVRRALAFALNYPDITDKAMNGYSSVIEPSLMVFDYEKALLDTNQIGHLQWSYNPQKAIEILEALGAVPGSDGIRVLPDGTRLGPWKVECPAGWTEWNATIEIAAQNAKAVGIELVPSFTEWGVYDNNKSSGDFDLTMDTPAAYSTPNAAFRRAFVLLDSNIPEIGEKAYWNYGRFQNDRVDAILGQIGTTSDEATLKKLYTELNVIYLENAPTIPLYYRPLVFYTYTNKVWNNFPVIGSNLPSSLFDAAGFLGLFKITN